MSGSAKDSGARYRIGTDIGGTFTDFTLIDDQTGEIFVTKRLTTPEQPDRAVIGGIEALGGDHPDLLAQSGAVVHATTLATNVVIERKGAPTGLLTTEGFRDILEIGRESRYHIYDLFIRFPEPLVARPLRLGVRERIYSDGRVLVPMEEDDVRKAAAVFRKAGVASIAVCFFHSYRNAYHELRAREILNEELPGVAISLSHEVHPEPKEYERTSTTVVDAYVKPVMDAYLQRLETSLADGGYTRNLLMMQSNGGTISAATARQHPIQIIESGPAAGVEAAAFYGRLLGVDDVLSFDMGGTTAKLCLIQQGRAARTRTFEVDRVHRFRQGSGIPVSIPVFDLLEIGAGGGSVARINDLGLVQVGPESAGSQPGPACYGLGGHAPTVTDADLVLGHLDAKSFLGGDMALDRDAAVKALDTHLGPDAGLSAVRAAAGIAEVVGETMASAARVYVADKGKDARDLTMVGFGGAGPLHVVSLARKLGCPSVIIPPLPGVMSSFGLLASGLAFEQSAPVRQLLDELDGARIEELRRTLEKQAAAALPADTAKTFLCVAEMWHLSQDYPLEVEIRGRFDDAAAVAGMRNDFAAVYEALYGRTDDDNPVELVSIRVQASTEAVPVRPPQLAAAAGPANPSRHRDVYHPSTGAMRRAAVHVRSDLGVGATIEGPAIIEERESTTVIGEGDRLTVNEIGCLVIEVAQQAPALLPEMEQAWS